MKTRIYQRIVPAATGLWGLFLKTGPTLGPITAIVTGGIALSSHLDGKIGSVRTEVLSVRTEVLNAISNLDNKFGTQGERIRAVEVKTERKYW